VFKEGNKWEEEEDEEEEEEKAKFRQSVRTDCRKENKKT